MNTTTIAGTNRLPHKIDTGTDATIPIDPRISFDVPQIDQRLAPVVISSDLISIGSLPKCGKQALALNVLRGTTIRLGNSATYISTRSTPEDLTIRFRSAIEGRTLKEIRQETYLTADEIVRRHYEGSHPDVEPPSCKIERIRGDAEVALQRTREVIDEHQAEVVILDNVSRLRSEVSDRSIREISLSQTVSELKELALDKNVVIVLLHDIRETSRSGLPLAVDSHGCRNVAVYSDYAIVADRNPSLDLRVSTETKVPKVLRVEMAKRCEPFDVACNWQPSLSRFQGRDE